ncbi:FMN-binding protein [Chitinispirillales bacterium ANBcel5]|uniref:FMN-binding protein n=1 Tax=Cellulosispirillum alkaliphilum TaxID=3039283 RepID=UPI002A536FEE|nr:FMN-binding protein [Chitinispirillales bacterium ANBcel5]
MKQKNKILFTLVAFMVAGAVIVAVTVFSFIRRAETDLGKMNSMVIEDVDLSTIENGTYFGEFEAFPITARVEVTVNDGAISAITILQHRSGRGGPAEKITDRVIEAQSLEVDTITGATLSSKVLQFAIMAALQSGRGQE